MLQLHFQYLINVKSADGSHIDIRPTTPFRQTSSDTKKSLVPNTRNEADEILTNQWLICSCGPRCPCHDYSEEHRIERLRHGHRQKCCCCSRHGAWRWRTIRRRLGHPSSDRCMYSRLPRHCRRRQMCNHPLKWRWRLTQPWRRCRMDG